MGNCITECLMRRRRKAVEKIVRASRELGTQREYHAASRDLAAQQLKRLVASKAHNREVKQWIAVYRSQSNQHAILEKATARYAELVDAASSNEVMQRVTIANEIVLEAASRLNLTLDKVRGLASELFASQARIDQAANTASETQGLVAGVTTGSDQSDEAVLRRALGLFDPEAAEDDEDDELASLRTEVLLDSAPRPNRPPSPPSDAVAQRRMRRTQEIAEMV
jgi:hypothetical protein